MESKKTENATYKIHTLGRFSMIVGDSLIQDTEWKRDKSLQLLQFLICHRQRQSLHREQIISWLWPDNSTEAGIRDFKSALHGINKIIQQHNTEYPLILRQGLTYQLNIDHILIDIDLLEEHFIIGSKALDMDEEEIVISSFQIVSDMYTGDFLPDRIFDDWSTEQREKSKTFAVSAMTELAEIFILRNPLESIRIAHKALMIDNTLEDAYRIIMRAYMEKGNRPSAIKTYNTCKEILQKEYGVSPLPETIKLYEMCLK